MMTYFLLFATLLGGTQGGHRHHRRRARPKRVLAGLIGFFGRV